MNETSTRKQVIRGIPFDRLHLDDENPRLPEGLRWGITIGDSQVSCSSRERWKSSRSPTWTTASSGTSR